LQRISATGVSVSSLTEFADALAVNRNHAIAGLGSLSSFLPIGWLHHARVSDFNSISPREPYARRSTRVKVDKMELYLGYMMLSPLNGNLRRSRHETGALHAVISVRPAAPEHRYAIPSQFTRSIRRPVPRSATAGSPSPTGHP